MIDTEAELERQAALYGGGRVREPEPDVETLKVPPHSIESEQAVLGGLMLAPEAWAEVADLLTEASFYRRDHQLIFRAISEAAEKSKPFDAVTLSDWFDAHGLAEQVAGGAYLINLASSTASAANIRAYAEIVAGKATLRELITVGTEIVGAAFQPNGRQPEEIVAEAASRMNQLSVAGAQTGGLRMIRSHLKEVLEDIERHYDGLADSGLPPPWENVAAILPGLEDTDLMLIAARPSMGKTVAGMEFADHAAAIGRNVAVFSLEMSSKQLTQRLLCRRTGIDRNRMRMKAGLEDEDWSRLTAAMRDLKSLPLAIDDTAAITIDALAARARRMHAKVEGGLGLIVIDYVQLISGSGRPDRRYEELTAISRGLKLLAKDLRCPVIALSQLNRALESRTDKRPTMADLRESGALEQDADVIAFLYRDDYYTKDRCGAPGITEFIIGKQRNGPTGTAYLRHELACSRFLDYHGPRPNYAPAKGGHVAEADGLDDEEPRPRRYAPRRGSRAPDRAAGVDA